MNMQTTKNSLTHAAGTGAAAVVFALAALFSPLPFAFCPSSAVAAADAPPPPRTLSVETAERLVPAKELLDKNDFPALLALVEQILPTTGADSFDRALLSQLRGQILLNLNPPRFADAVKPLEDALALTDKHNFFDTGTTLTLLHTLSQIHCQNNALERAHAHIARYLRLAPNPAPDIFLYDATLLYTAAEKGGHITGTARALFLAARSAARESILRRPRADTPSLILTLATHQQLGEHLATAELLELLAASAVPPVHGRDNSPLPQYLQQLFALYTALAADPATAPRDVKKYQLRALLAAERLRATGTVPTTGDTQNHIALLAALKQYRAAAELIERSIADKTLAGTRRDYELLAATWQQQRDIPRAAAALKAAIARHPDDPELHYALARLYYAEERSADAYEPLRRAVAGKLEKPADAWFLLAFIAYELQRFADAREFAATAAKQPNAKLPELAKLTTAINDAIAQNTPPAASPATPSPAAKKL
jgi:Flp pilus assembly protein TadD